MAPKNKSQSQNPVQFLKNYLNINYLKSLIFNRSNLIPVAVLIFCLECFINLIIVKKVKYTEIDWKAYMQEVEGVLNGTFDYSLLKGDTGPLVYPAGFVWIFSGLYFLTNKGTDVRFAQYIFVALYLINLALVLRIYVKAKKIPPFVLILTCLTSYRIHSIFALRLFNDPIAMILLYASINAFIDSKWHVGSFLYSLAVSVKMNILLFAPALLLAYLKCLGLIKTIHQLIICASVQVIVAIPFLLTHPVNYLIGAFNLGRVFLYEWTVNWRFLPENIFVDKKFHVGLLIIHLVVLGLFFKYCHLLLKSYATLQVVEKDIKSQLKKSTKFNINESSQLFLLPMFLCNFIGIACSRSLHYQFYIWYFHTLPYLVWSTHYYTPVKLSILGIIEMCWNTFPSTSLSSFSLHCCHIAILYGIYKTQSLIDQLAPSKQKIKNKEK